MLVRTSSGRECTVMGIGFVAKSTLSDDKPDIR